MEHIFALFLMFHGGAPAAVVPANSFLCGQIEMRVSAGQSVALNVGLPELAQGEYPLVIANILAQPLKLLAPLLCAHVAPGGDLILAGILSRQADELKAAYAPWLALDVTDEEDGWILMTAKRAA